MVVPVRERRSVSLLFVVWTLDSTAASLTPCVPSLLSPLLTCSCVAAALCELVDADVTAAVELLQVFDLQAAETIAFTDKKSGREYSQQEFEAVHDELCYTTYLSSGEHVELFPGECSQSVRLLMECVVLLSSRFSSCPLNHHCCLVC